MTGPFRGAGRSGICRGIVWDAQPLGNMTDRELARRLRVNTETVRSARKRRGITSFRRSMVDRCGARALLGTAPDHVVASRCGLKSESTVRKLRRRAGIAPYHVHPAIDWSCFPLGQAWDEDVGALAGVSHSAVAQARKARGIARYTEARVCACLRPFRANCKTQRWCSKECSAAAAQALHFGAADETVAAHVAIKALRREANRIAGRDRRAWR